MKKILLGIACFFAYIFSMQAQTLYGTTANGGNDGGGTINEFIPATNNLIVAKSFESIASTNGINPSASLVQASDGKLYGMTTNGGSNDAGVIFSFDPISSTYTKLKDFDNTNGAHPYGSLIQATDGNLYGMTRNGGSSDAGVIFSFDPISSTFTKLKDFDNYNYGAYPYGSLMQARDGKLYGMTVGTSLYIYGNIFSFDPSSSTYTVLKNFDGINGYAPRGNLVQASDGKLYGMTSLGGGIFVKGGWIVPGEGPGNIFSYDPLSTTIAVLKVFDGINGEYPLGSLKQANDGKFYGMTGYGGSGGVGVIFSFDPISSTYTKLKDFDNTNGTNPQGSLMQASDGKLYGMTTNGGSSDAGVIFSFDPISSTYTKLKDFDNTNGANPYIGSTFIELKECITDTTYYKDADSDGYGNPADSIRACSQSAGYVTNNTDCNDNNSAIHAPVTYYRDTDGDGYGDANNSISVCETIPPGGYVINNYDCDDHDKLKKAGNEKVIMCHNGKPECVIANEIQKRLEKGWTLGPCTPALATMDAAENVAIYGKEQSIPHEYKLSNYPNPFKGTSAIKYELPFDSKVSIKVYDLMGRVLATLVNGDKKAGTYTIDFNAGNLSKGSLYYRITATSKDQQFEQTNKMIQIQ